MIRALKDMNRMINIAFFNSDIAVRSVKHLYCTNSSDSNLYRQLQKLYGQLSIDTAVQLIGGIVTIQICMLATNCHPEVCEILWFPTSKTHGVKGTMVVQIDRIDWKYSSKCFKRITKVIGLSTGSSGSYPILSFSKSSVLFTQMYILVVGSLPLTLMHAVRGRKW